MLPKSSYLDAPTIAEDINETTNGNEMGDLKPTAIDENNNNSVKRANTVLEPNNILGAHILEEKTKRFYQWADNYDVLNNNSYKPTKGIEMGGFHIFTGGTGNLNLTKTVHNGKLKTRIVNEVSTSNKSGF